MGHSQAQELYVSTEPASNMATGSIGQRMNSRLFRMNHSNRFSSYRLEPEIMAGISKRTMIHVAAYGSDMFQKNFRFEGASLYAKYRLYSSDEVHEHFRIAAYAKASLIDNPQVLITTVPHLVPDGNGNMVAHEEEVHLQANDIDIDGNNSGVTAGLVATHLKNKLALSASAGYARRLENANDKIEIFQPVNALTYTLSSGYLLFPRNYVSYKQTNVNLYFELVGQDFPGKKLSYLDAAPALQFIFNSICRVDVGYHTQIAGNISRLSNSYFQCRVEYNLLNVFGNK